MAESSLPHYDKLSSVKDESSPSSSSAHVATSLLPHSTESDHASSKQNSTEILVQEQNETESFDLDCVSTV